MKNAKKFSKAETEHHKKLFLYEDTIGILSVTLLFVLTILASLVEMPDFLRVALIAIGFAEVIVSAILCLEIEVETGEYQCAKCGHNQKPSYWQVFWAMHFGRTRYLSCPKCQKKSWQRKVI